MIILVYHYFTEESDDRLACSASELEQQVDYLRRHCAVVPLLEGLRAIERGEPLAPRAVAITVDDCDSSFYELGWPVFRKYNLPLFCNVITGSFGRTLDMGRRLNLMDRRGLEALLESGLVALGSHSVTHPRFNDLSPDRVAEELAESKRDIESLQGHCEVFCYPYGAVETVTPHTERLLLETGYRYALNTCGGRVGPKTDRLRIGRINIFRGLGRALFPWYANGAVSSLLALSKRLRGQRFYSGQSPAGPLFTGSLTSSRGTIQSARRPVSLVGSGGSPEGRSEAASGVSVVIPLHNNAATVGVAIQSAMSQTARPLEVIVVDDGSTDDSAAIASGFGPPVSCLSQPCRGPAAARNTGVRAARGSFIAFLDADDFWQPEFLETCCDFLQAHPDCIAVSTGLCFIRPDGKLTYGPACAFDGNRPLGEPRVLESFLEFWARHDHVRTGSLVVRRDVLLAVGLQTRNCASRKIWSFGPCWACKANGDSFPHHCGSVIPNPRPRMLAG